MSRRKRATEEDVNPEAWLAIYCDAVTLLLTFFILLYSTATVDQEKFDSLSNALKGHFSGEGVLSGGSNPSIEYNILEDLVITNENKEALKSNLELMIEDKNLENSVSVKNTSRGILLELKNSILFDSGTYTLKQDGIAVLDSVYELISNIQNRISIEGHTDNVQVTSSNLSNWELSAQRSVNVLRYFIESKGMDPTLFSANGYGEYKPLYDNSTEEGRAKNRRVEILIETQGEGM